MQNSQAPGRSAVCRGTMPLLTMIDPLGGWELIWRKLWLLLKRILKLVINGRWTYTTRGEKDTKFKLGTKSYWPTKANGNGKNWRRSGNPFHIQLFPWILNVILTTSATPSLVRKRLFIGTSSSFRLLADWGWITWTLIQWQQWTCRWQLWKYMEIYFSLFIIISESHQNLFLCVL